MAGQVQLDGRKPDLPVLAVQTLRARHDRTASAGDVAQRRARWNMPSRRIAARPVGCDEVRSLAVLLGQPTVVLTPPLDSEAGA